MDRTIPVLCSSIRRILYELALINHTRDIHLIYNCSFFFYVDFFELESTKICVWWIRLSLPILHILKIQTCTNSQRMFLVRITKQSEHSNLSLRVSDLHRETCQEINLFALLTVRILANPSPVMWPRYLFIEWSVPSLLSISAIILFMHLHCYYSHVSSLLLSCSSEIGVLHNLH